MKSFLSKVKHNTKRLDPVLQFTVSEVQTTIRINAVSQRVIFLQSFSLFKRTQQIYNYKDTSSEA